MSDSFDINLKVYGRHPNKGVLVAWSDVLPILEGLKAHIENVESRACKEDNKDD